MEKDFINFSYVRYWSCSGYALLLLQRHKASGLSGAYCTVLPAAELGIIFHGESAAVSLLVPLSHGYLLAVLWPSLPLY